MYHIATLQYRNAHNVYDTHTCVHTPHTARARVLTHTNVCTWTCPGKHTACMLYAIECAWVACTSMCIIHRHKHYLVVLIACTFVHDFIWNGKPCERVNTHIYTRTHMKERKKER